MRIRKCISFLLVALLLASNSGVAFGVHFCGGEVASVEPMFASGEVTGCSGMPSEKDNSCCKDKVVKTEKSHETIVKTFSVAFDAVYFASAEIPSAKKPLQVFIEKPVATYYCDANAPPLYRLYSQYVFYA